MLRDVDLDQWLAENAKECSRYNARLTPNACLQRQRLHPESCAQCEHAEGRGLTPEEMKQARKDARYDKVIAEKTRKAAAKPQICTDCGKRRPVAKGLCSACYNRMKYGKPPKARLDPEVPATVQKQRKKQPCVQCGRMMRLMGHGLCGKCYSIWRRSDEKTVVDAGAEVVAVQAAPAAVVVPEFAARLDATLAEVRQLLVSKNEAYGNSALEPVRVFSQADPVEQLRVRLDDKISRLVRGEAAGEDTEQDLLGYLILLRMARAA